MISDKLYRIIICATLPVLFATASAQGRRAVTYQFTHAGGHNMEMSVYLYDDVDVQPQFPGGDNAMLQYINRERRYPAEAYNAGVEGRVLCSFIVSADGRVLNVEVIKGHEESLNREAVRIIRNMPRWEAGRMGNTAVPVYCILPIPFRL